MHTLGEPSCLGGLRGEKKHVRAEIAGSYALFLQFPSDTKMN